MRKMISPGSVVSVRGGSANSDTSVGIGRIGQWRIPFEGPGVEEG